MLKNVIQFQNIISDILSLISSLTGRSGNGIKMSTLRKTEDLEKRVKLLQALSGETAFGIVFSLFIAKQTVSAGLFLPGLHKISKLTGENDLQRLRGFIEHLEKMGLITGVETPVGVLYEITEEGNNTFSNLLGKDRSKVQKLIAKIADSLSNTEKE